MLENKNIKYLIIHCSDTPNYENIGASDIHKMHLNFGWNGIGYHKIIKRNGQIENGRPEYWVGAHIYGKNKKSLGVCLIGRDKFTENQFISLKETISNWKAKYPKAIIMGHKDAIKTEKTCPNFDVNIWCKENNLE
jgi:N-acetylmuramoyl-L-alanine amidase